MLNPETQVAREGSNERTPDVRDIVDYADSIGQLARINGADWNLEIGVLAEIFAHSSPGRSPAVLFDNIKEYPKGFRVLKATPQGDSMGLIAPSATRKRSSG